VPAPRSRDRKLYLCDTTGQEVSSSSVTLTARNVAQVSTNISGQVLDGVDPLSWTPEHWGRRAGEDLVPDRVHVSTGRRIHSIVLGPLFFVLTCVFARPYLNEASASATELLELWVLLTCTKRRSPFASSGNSACGRQRTWELLTPWHAGQVASRVYERVATCTSLSGFVTTRMSLMRRPVMTTDITHPAAPWGSR
jgi:hypothetical protein